MDHKEKRKTGIRSLPKSIWALGFVSLFMDMSSEAIHSLLPVYLVSVLGASAATVGLIDGISEATASITKIFSGAISDWFGKYKLLTVIGYGAAALTKPLFPLAATPFAVFTARFIDRISKGIRGAPRDALVSELTPSDQRGASFGLRQGLDTVGAFAGPILAIIVLYLTGNSYRAVFWFAVIPAFISVAILIFFVREPTAPKRVPKFPLTFNNMRGLGSAYWITICIASLFTLARFSEAFLILRVSTLGISLFLAPLVLVVMNVAYAASSYPAGLLSDRVGRWGVLMGGLVVLIIADTVLAVSNNFYGVFFGIALWGLHMGLTQGVFSALIADTVSAPIKGTAFGIFYLLTGMATLVASVVAGILWDSHGPAATFMTGAVITALSLCAIIFWNIIRKK